MRGWYKDTTDPPPPPSRLTINWVTEERLKIYLHVPLPVRCIPVEVTLFPVEDSITGEADILEAVKHIFMNRSGVTSGMRVSHLCQWIQEATWK